MTSDYEGWGLTLTEAMQYKCVPVVMSTYSSIFDIVEDGKNGCLILNVDCKTMADKVLWLAENPQKLQMRLIRRHSVLLLIRLLISG